MTQNNVKSLSLVRFDNNSYSAPVKYAHRSMIVVEPVNDMKLGFKDRLIAWHHRHWDREGWFLNFVPLSGT